MSTSSCRNCRRPIVFMALAGVGWLHEELPQYAHEPITCENPHPVECRRGRCDDPHIPAGTEA